MIQRRELPSPLLLPLLFWLAGMVLAHHLSGALLWPAFLVAVPLFVTAVWCKKLRLWIMPLLLICLGYIRLSLVEEPRNLLAESLQDERSKLQSLVIQPRQLISAEYNSYDVLVLKVGEVTLRERAIFYADSTLIPGALYAGLCELRELISDPILDITPRRYSAKIYPVMGLKLLQDGKKPSFIPALRQKLFRRLKENTGSDTGLAQALLLSDLSSKNELREVLSRGGLVHLIVVSGLHIYFVYYLLVTVLGFVIPRRYGSLPALVLALGFTALNGWSPPVLRALLMIMILRLGKLLGRPISFLQIMALSLWIVSLISPLEIFGLSLQLSYYSIFIITQGVPYIWVHPEDPLLKRIPRYFLSFVLTNIIASLGILPLTLYHFGMGSLNGIIGNLLAVPLISLLLPLSFLMALLPPAWGLTATLSLSYRFLSQFFISWAGWVAELPFLIQYHYISFQWLLAGLILVMLLLLVFRGRWQRLRRLVLPALGLILLLLLFPKLGKFHPGIYVYNCGNADCSLIRLDPDTELMIDTGGVYGLVSVDNRLTREQLLDDNWMQRRLLKHLSKSGVRELELVVLTHLHNDHYGGLAALLKAIQVKRLVIDSQALESEIWHDLAQELDLSRTELLPVEGGDRLKLGSAVLHILHPDAEFEENDPNNRSLVLRVDWQGKRFLFTGDIEQEAESYLLQNQADEIRADYLKVPHHGSISSSTVDFVQAVGAEEAWISCAGNSRFRFPHPEVMRRYEAAGTRVKQTAGRTIFFSVNSEQ